MACTWPSKLAPSGSWLSTSRMPGRGSLALLPPTRVLTATKHQPSWTYSSQTSSIPIGIAEAVIVHPALQRPRAARFQDGDLVHADRFLAQHRDRLLQRLGVLEDQARHGLASGTHATQEELVAARGMDDDLGRIRRRGEVREHVVAHLADRRRRRERDQHPELVHLALEAGPQDDRLDAVLVEHVGLLEPDAAIGTLGPT